MRNPLPFLRNSALAAALCALALGACGQKGPLVLPGRAKDTPWPAPAEPPPPRVPAQAVPGAGP